MLGSFATIVKLPQNVVSAECRELGQASRIEAMPLDIGCTVGVVFLAKLPS